MKLITGRDAEILRKYLKGRVIEESDKFYVRRMMMAGFMKGGYSFKEKKPTAKTTSLGRNSI